MSIYINMAAPKGNRYAADALSYCKTTEHRQQAFQAYCTHVEKGCLKKAFRWKSDDGKGLANYRTMYHVIETYGNELNLFLLELAEAANLLHWSSKAEGLVDGTTKGQGFVWVNWMHNAFTNLHWNISQPKQDETKQSDDQRREQSSLSEIADLVNGE